jgi:hypothetical protein
MWTKNPARTSAPAAVVVSSQDAADDEDETDR